MIIPLSIDVLPRQRGSLTGATNPPVPRMFPKGGRAQNPIIPARLRLHARAAVLEGIELPLEYWSGGLKGESDTGGKKKRRSRSLHIYLTERRARSRARAMQREGGKKTQQGARQREPRGGSRVSPRAYRMHVREHDSR